MSALAAERLRPTTTLYASKEVRDAVLKSPMASGVAESYDTLAEVLGSTLARVVK